MSEIEEKLLKALENPRTQEALLEIVEKLPTVRDVVRALADFKVSGVLDDMINLAFTTRFLTEGLLTKDLMERVGKLQEVAFTAGGNLAQDPAKLDCLTNAIAMADASKPIGLMGLLTALRDPEVQKGLGYFVSLLKHLGSCLTQKQ